MLFFDGILPKLGKLVALNVAVEGGQTTPSCRDDVAHLPPTGKVSVQHVQVVLQCAEVFLANQLRHMERKWIIYKTRTFQPIVNLVKTYFTLQNPTNPGFQF